MFITLSLSAEAQNQRLNARYQNLPEASKKAAIEFLMKTYNHFEPALEGEDNAINIEIEPTMTREDVVDLILQKVAK